jgi:hypothetical protein
LQGRAAGYVCSPAGRQIVCPAASGMAGLTRLHRFPETGSALLPATLLFYVVVRRLFGDLHVVDVGFANSG